MGTLVQGDNWIFFGGSSFFQTKKGNRRLVHSTDFLFLSLSLSLSPFLCTHSLGAFVFNQIWPRPRKLWRIIQKRFCVQGIGPFTRLDTQQTKVWVTTVHTQTSGSSSGSSLEPVPRWPVLCGKRSRSASSKLSLITRFVCTRTSFSTNFWLRSRLSLLWEWIHPSIDQ